MTLVVWLPFLLLWQVSGGDSLLTAGVHLLFPHCAVIILKIISECEQEKKWRYFRSTLWFKCPEFSMSSADNYFVSSLRNIQSRLRCACGCCVSAYLLYVQPIETHLPFHQRSLQDVTQDNFYSSQTVLFCPLNQKCKQVRKGWGHHRLRHKQTDGKRHHETRSSQEVGETSEQAGTRRQLPSSSPQSERLCLRFARP